MNPDELSSLALAHIGDAVYELLLREELVKRGLRTAEHLHKETIKYACATYQAAAADRLIPYFDEEELAVFRRGRNAHCPRVPKASTPRDYSYATALEAVFGHLYLSGKKERIRELFDICMRENNDGI